MNIRQLTLLLLPLCALVSASLAEDLEHHDSRSAITDLKTQLAGTSWKAAPVQQLRPGLAPVLTFTDTTVAPAGYKYDVNAPDSLTIHFNHGDTQLMLLAKDGRHLKLVFHDHEYTYGLKSH